MRPDTTRSTAPRQSDAKQIGTLATRAFSGSQQSPVPALVQHYGEHRSGVENGWSRGISIAQDDEYDYGEEQTD